MSDTIKAKIINIRLKPDAEPITISGFAYASGEKEAMKFPILRRQQNGWNSREATRIVKEHGDRYELVKDGLPVGGCCK